MFLTILSLLIGYLTLSVSIALLYSIGIGTGLGVTELGPPDQAMTASFMAFAAVCSLGFATLSGYLTAIVAKRAPVFHTGLLAVLLAAVWGVSTFLLPSVEPLSMAILNLVIGVAGVMAGGTWRLRQMKAKEEV